MRIKRRKIKLLMFIIAFDKKIINFFYEHDFKKK